MGWLEKDTRSAAECSGKSDIPKGPREGEKWGGKSSGITRTNGKSCSKKKNPLGQDRGRGTGWERTPQPGWQRAEGALSCTGQRLPCIQRSTAEQRRASAPPFCRRGALSTGGTRSCCSASRGGPRKWPRDGTAPPWGWAEAAQREGRGLRGDLRAVCQHPKGSCGKGGVSLLSGVCGDGARGFKLEAGRLRWDKRKEPFLVWVVRH